MTSAESVHELTDFFVSSYDYICIIFIELSLVCFSCKCKETSKVTLTNYSHFVSNLWTVSYEQFLCTCQTPDGVCDVDINLAFLQVLRLWGDSIVSASVSIYALSLH